MDYKIIVLIQVLLFAAASAASDKTKVVGDLSLQILGKSGKIRLCPATDVSDDGCVTLQVDKIQETDANGDPVCTTGKDKHTFQTMANQDFSCIGPVEGKLYNSEDDADGEDAIDGYIISCEATLSGMTSTFSITIFMNKEEGKFKYKDENNNDQELTLGLNSAKYTIELDNWDFCAEATHLEIHYEVKARKGKKASGSGTDVELGDAKLINLEVAVIDGITKSLNAPKTSDQGSKTITVYRFPKFTRKLVYDPIYSGSPLASVNSLLLLGASLILAKIMY